MDWEETGIQTSVDEEEGGGEGWIVTFSDLMSLLLTFFILLYSMSTVEVSKFKQLMKSVQSALGVQQVPEAGTREGLEMLNKDGKPEPDAVDELGGMVQKELQEIQSKVEEFIIKNKLGGKVSVEVGERGAVITISDVVLFPPGEAQFTREAKPILEKLTELVKEFPYMVRVEGHTDNVPIHNSRYPSNWELSSARASEIVRFFIKHGVDPRRLVAAGYAHYRPIADNSTPEGRAKNRRVEIVYVRESIEKTMQKGLAMMGVSQPKSKTAAQEKSSSTSKQKIKKKKKKKSTSSRKKKTRKSSKRKSRKTARNRR